jgi:heme/copper-type cytochrome/quinol oxidase subunit 3
MAIFMGGWSMMLLALLFAYADVRLQAPAWPPAGEPLPPRDLPSLATLVLGAASLALERARRRRAPSLATPLLLALVFLALQLLVWTRLYHEGLEACSPFGTVFWTLTLFHGAHVAVAILGLLVTFAHVAVAILGLLVTFAYKRSDQRFGTRLRNWAIFWHGLFAAWLVIFVAVYLV